MYSINILRAEKLNISDEILLFFKASYFVIILDVKLNSKFFLAKGSSNINIDNLKYD